MRDYKINQEVIREIVRRIVNTSMPEKIILFGSYAYGSPGEDSDIDILVIKSDIDSKIREYTKIRKGLRGLRYPFDIIIISPEEYEFYSLKWQNSIIAEAREKGNVLYERQTRV